MRTLFLSVWLGAGALALAACGAGDDAAAPDGAANGASTDMASVSVALSYRERIALSDTAIAQADLVATPQGAGGPFVIARSEIELGGRQVPAELTIEYDPSAIPASGELAVSGRIIDRATGMTWHTPQDASFAAGNRTADLGMIMLERAAHAGSEPRRFTCEDATGFTASYVSPHVDLVLDGESVRLDPVVSASGARFEAGEAGTENHILFWSRGNSALFARGGADPVTCEAEMLPEPVAEEPAAPEAASDEAAYIARGNEPGWLLRLSGDEAEYLGSYGEVRIAGRVTAREALEEGESRLTIEGSDGTVLTASISDLRCSDTMTGVTYPDTVAVTLGEESFSGCGGDAESLLTGGAWTVTHVAGQEVPGPRAVTLEFDGQGRLSGQGPCNRYSAGYQLTGEGLIISQGVSTRMACVSDLMALESVFLETLQGSLSTNIDEEGVLSLGEGRILAVRE